MTTKHTPETLEALNGSIAKWENIVAGTGPELGKDNCPLCYMFFSRCCVGCPVMKRTGEFRCLGTPYNTARLAMTAHYDERGIFAGHFAETPEAKAAAQEELDFLKSLLPEPDKETGR